MKITAVAPWFGAKRTIAPKIVESIGPHSAYWEPFCGSCAVLFAKEPCRLETVNDLHGELINLCRVLADENRCLDLYRRAERFVLHEDLFREAASNVRARSESAIELRADVSAAADFLVTSWFGRNGVQGTKSYNQGFCVRFTNNGGHAAKRWRSAVESIPAWHSRLKCVTILNRDAFDVLARIGDEAGTVVYCDPPYLVKGAKYVHDFESEDHQSLADALHRFKRARVVVSYYDHPRLEELYPGWSCRRMDITKSLSNANGRREVATEVLLINERQKNLF